MKIAACKQYLQSQESLKLDNACSFYVTVINVDSDPFYEAWCTISLQIIKPINEHTQKDKTNKKLLS